MNRYFDLIPSVLIFFTSFRFFFTFKDLTQQLRCGKFILHSRKEYNIIVKLDMIKIVIPV